MHLMFFQREVDEKTMGSTKKAQAAELDWSTAAITATLLKHAVDGKHKNAVDLPHSSPALVENFGTQLPFKTKGECYATQIMEDNAVRRSRIGRTVMLSFALCLAAMMGCAGTVQILTITSVTPTNVAAGSGANLTITGKQFSSNMTVVLGTTALPTSFVSSTSLTAAIPANLAGGTYTVGVRDNGNSYAPAAVLGSTLTVNVTNPAPSLASVAPNFFLAGSAMATAAVVGNGFVSGTVAAVDGSSRAVSVQDASHLTVALTADDLLYATSRQLVITNPAPGGGDAASATLIITDYAKPANSYSAYGDSITYGYGVLPDPPYPYTLAMADGLTLLDHGQTGDQACDTFQRLYPTRDEYTASTGRVYSYMIGTNETYYKGTGAYETVYNTCDQAVLSWLALSRPNKIIAGDAGLVTTGGCSSSPDTSRFGVAYCQSAGAVTATLQTANNPIYIWYYVDDSAPSAASLQVSIDGANVTSLPTQLTPLIATMNGGSRSIALLRIPISEGVHAIAMAAPSGNAGVLGVGTVPRSRNELSFIVAGDVPNQSQYPRAPIATQVQYAADARANVALLLSDGLDIRFAETRLFMLGTPAEMSDQLHPNKLGHAHLQAAFQTGFTNLNSSTGPRAAVKQLNGLPRQPVTLVQPEESGAVFRIASSLADLATIANVSKTGQAAIVCPPIGESIDTAPTGLLLSAGDIVTLLRSPKGVWSVVHRSNANCGGGCTQ